MQTNYGELHVEQDPKTGRYRSRPPSPGINSAGHPAAAGRRESGGPPVPPGAGPHAHGKPAHHDQGRPKYRSKLEARYAGHLEALQHTGEIREFRHESITLTLANRCRFTPDFHVLLPDGRHEFREVKGWAREDAIIKIRVAARLYRWARFILITRPKGEWVEREVQP